MFSFSLMNKQSLHVLPYVYLVQSPIEGMVKLVFKSI